VNEPGEQRFRTNVQGSLESLIRNFGIAPGKPVLAIVGLGPIDIEFRTS
jgi:hypothetical protein